MADWLRFHFVIARRRYTGSSAPADSADCRFGDMARGREGGRGGEGRGGEGGGDCPHFPQTRTFVTAEPSRPPAKPLRRWRHVIPKSRDTQIHVAGFPGL